jgi:hypothetical protein
MPYQSRPEQRGENNPRTLLSPQQVLAAKKLLGIEGVQQRMLAQLLNVSDGAINHIASARNWGWLEIESDGAVNESDEQPPAREPFALVQAPELPPDIMATLAREEEEAEQQLMHREFLWLDPSRWTDRHDAAKHVLACGICQHAALTDSETFSAWGSEWSLLLLSAARDAAAQNEDEAEP